MTSDLGLLKKYQKHDIPTPPSPPNIEHTPHVIRTKPITKKSQPQVEQDAIVLDEDYYLKRHRRHEKEEKTQKNREKERLKHGYYQQKQLVERIKTMDKSLLQSIVSSIRHRTHSKEEVEAEEWDEEEYLEDLHVRLLNDAMEHLRRYEVLGLSSNKQGQQEVIVEEEPDLSPQSIPTNSNTTNTTLFHQTLQSEAVKQRSRQLKSFLKQPMFAGDSIQRGSRRSTRHVVAFGQKLPDLLDTIQEFSLPNDILKFKKHKK